MLESELGPYKILAELGSGGMGTVYHAAVVGEAPGIEPGTEVAVKVVHPHLLATPGFFKRFLREADIGKQVRHENVVATLDVDATLFDGKQVNYMVLEYVKGRSLRGLLNDLGVVPETLLRALAIQMADGLSAIHELGIIHRDLKPENVLITDDDRVRIMDLGVAKLQEASVAITREGQFAGSFLYAAPEQFRKGAVGPAADLYSLGVMLHELASGENPFRGEDPSTVIAAHLSEHPPPPQDVSPFLAEVVQTLLAKDADARFASARELHDVLVEGEASGWWSAREAELKAKTPVPAIQVRRECDIFGRETEMQMLEEAWARAKEGRGSCLLVEGEPGIGKTRLVDAFLQSLAREEAHLLYGAYRPAGGLGAISEAVLAKFGRSGLEETLAPYLTVTPTLVPSFVALLRQEVAPTGAAPLQGDALHAVTCHLMEALAAERPSVWVLDEIHFAPQESRQLLLAMASALAGHRVLLLLTARPGLDLPHLTRLEQFRRLPVGRLSPREVIQLLRASFKSETLAEKLGGKIAYKSDGVPMFVFEMVRSLKESGALKQLPDGTFAQSDVISDIEIPSAVRDLIGSRLNALDDDDRNLLDAASVDGYEFDPELVATVTETKAIKVLQRLASLERKTGVIRASGARYRFDHHQIQEVLYAELPEALKRGYHGLIAETRAERAGEDPPADEAALIAMHHLRSSTPKAALPFLPKAREHLSGAFRNEAFLQMADLALPILEGEEKVKVLSSKGSILQHLGRSAEAGDTLHAAREAADALGDYALRCETRRDLSWLYWGTGEYEKAKAAIEEARTIARDAGDEKMEKSAVTRLGAIYSSLGHHEKALEHEEAENNRGLAYQYRGRVGEAVASFGAALEEARTDGDRLREGIALVNLGRIQALLGDLESGRKTLEESRDILRSIGARRPESYAYHRLGMVAEQAGDLAEAERMHDTAIAMRREQNYPYGLSRSLLRLGVVRLHQERTDEAKLAFQEAYELARKIDTPDPVVLAAAYLTRVGGEADAARAAFERYEERLRAHDAMEARFVLWQGTGDRAQLDEAHRLHRLILDHTPEEHRAATLELPLHRDIVAAAAG